MRKNICGIVLVMLTTTFVQAEVDSGNVRLTGRNPEYAGINLVFERYTNFIVPQTTPLMVMPIDDTGKFDFIFPLESITYAYVDLGRFRANIYFEPGFTYELVFPPFEPLTESQRLNPHFRREEVWLGIANAEARDLNRNIGEFDATFEHLYNSNAVQLFVHSNAEKAREIHELLEARFTFSHPLFQRHKELSYLKLWHMTVRRQDRRFIHEYLSDKPVDFGLPVYWDIFNTLFTGFLPKGFSPDVEKSLLRSLQYGTNFDSIVNIAIGDTLFVQREFAEAVLLFGLYESFYKKTISENRVLTLTSSAKESAYSENARALASQLHSKMYMLRPGSQAPEFTLRDIKGKEHSLSDYRGKFVYLNFMHTKNYNCLRDIQTMEQFARMFRKELEIVTVFIDDDYDAMETFLSSSKQYRWDFLHFGTSPRVLFDYNIVAVPAYYLIDPQGTLSLSPAPGPEENFRELFADRYRAYQREELRRNPPRERSIFRW